MVLTQKSPPVRGAVHELLTAGIATQVPRLEALMGRLRLQAGIVEEIQLEDALHALHASASSLDFRLLQARGSGSIARRQAQAAGAELSLLVSRLRTEARNVWTCLQTVAAGNARHAASVPALLDKFRAAAGELENSVALATLLTQRSLEAAPAAGLHERLRQLQGFCAEARRVYRLSQERSAGRVALEATLQERVVRLGNELQDSVRLLLMADDQAQAVPALIEAGIERRQQLLAGVVQSCAEIVRLHEWDHELGARLALMAQQARLAA
ncbi:MAG: hypothetical protein JWP65_1560 [Ramlibacter sp.]|jgi:hypothetical protein|uniref:hypothetical protein n=1 Tax=Ramlibacter sp. TaxID=1917967 RepID=UPI00262A4653|nr:hypothetical protein [Ramlibacter sp.]MDB5751139.1 hypothetical protein [Ramlibacter sp.]